MISESERIEQAIHSLLENRNPAATICPSEAARKVFPENWREQMELTRQVARRLANDGAIEICQKGEKIDPTGKFRGPIRLRFPK